MQNDIASARKCYSRAKDGIIEAIAFAVLVYRTVENNRNAAAKIDNQIATRNSKIGAHNKHQQDDRERAIKLAEGILADKGLGNDDRAHLKAIAALSEDQWKVKYIKLPIRAH